MTKKVWFGLSFIVILSTVMTFIAPVNEVFKGIISLPAIGALLAALFQLFRDENNHQRKKGLQNEQQLYNLGATSHMANTVFDKHVEFCELYLKEVHQLLATLFREGPTELALNHSSKLYQLRMQYTAWITPEIDDKLTPFESAVRKIGANQGYIEALRQQGNAEEQRLAAIQELYEIFNSMMDLDQSPKLENAESFTAIKERIRDILQVKKLTEIREYLVNRAYEIGKDQNGK